MPNYKVANRYASSFLRTSVDKNILEEVYKDFKFVYNTFGASSELKRAMKSPIIKPETKRNILNALFADKISKDSLEFVQFIAEKGRENFLEDILDQFFSQYDNYLGIAKVFVTTAFDLTKDQKDSLKEKFASILNKKVEMIYSVDKSIIGGFVAKVGDTVYDASVLHQLELLKKQFVHGSVAIN
jgi:F-type H+-transporting ATPase subunit delta